ncbi:MAG: hypothetical protein ACOYOU_01845 [Kiritimatiellia bacterium]
MRRSAGLAVLRWAAGLVFLAVLAGCLAPQAADSTGTLQRHNWWNYYQRGRAFLTAHQPDAAQKDFECALGLRSGARFGDDQDRWRARTYGLHFVDGYFPNRELGIAFFEQNDLTNAVRWLERSLKQTPSSRAKHYLNRAHEREVKSLSPPVPHIAWEGAGSVLTREHTAVVRGTAAAAGYASRVTIAGQVQPVELAQTTLPFDARVDLHEGPNAIMVEVMDLAGQRNTAQRTWIADWQPPLLTVTRVTREVNGPWRVAGVCRDDRGLAAITLDATPLPRPAGSTETAWPFDVRIGNLGAVVTAVDRAGNRLETRLAPDNLTTADAVLRHPGALALNDTPAQAPATDATPATRLAPPATDTSGDRLPPSLNLRGARDVCVVFDAEFFLDGTAADGGGLRSVTINGEDLLIDNDRGAVRSCFARRVPLTLGTNTLEVAAVDRAGNRTARQMLVVRRQPEYLDASLRLAVGVPPLLPENAGPASLRAKRGMESELVRDPVRFRLLERDEGWDYILREQGLSISDLADPRAALRIGKLMPAELLLMGRLITEARGLTLYVKAVDTASGEILFATDIYSVDPDRSLDEDAAGLILKIKQGFPLVAGEVVRRHGTTATLSIGMRNGAAVGSRFVVLRGAAEENAPDGSLRRIDGRPIQLSMERVQQESGTARIVPDNARESVKEGDHVYAR